MYQGKSSINLHIQIVIDVPLVLIINEGFDLHPQGYQGSGQSYQFLGEMQAKNQDWVHGPSIA